MSLAKRISNVLAVVGITLVPMAGTLLGAVIDERTHLGYSTWLSACREAGFSLASVLRFTYELLPGAIIGLLLGALAIQAVGLCLRHRGETARLCLAAHGGCVLGMAGGMLLCTLMVPGPWMLGVDALLAIGGATVLLRLTRRRGPPASVRPRSRGLASAQ